MALPCGQGSALPSCGQPKKSHTFALSRMMSYNIDMMMPIARISGDCSRDQKLEIIQETMG